LATGPNDRNAVDLRWVGGFLWPERFPVLGILALSLAATGIALAQPYVTRLLIDRGLIERQPAVVLRLAALMVALVAASTALGWVNLRAYTTVSARILFGMRERTYRHLLALSPDFHARTGAGELIARLDGDIAELQRFGLDSLLTAVNALIALAGTLAILAWMSGPLALIALVLLPAQLAYLRLARPRVEQATRRLRERSTAISRFLVDTLTEAKFIQAAGGAERETARLGGLNAAMLEALVEQQRVGFLAGGVPGLLGTLGTAAVFVVGGYVVAEGRLSVGTLIAFTVYLARAAGPAQSLLGLYVAWQRARVSIDRVGALWRERPAVASPAEPVALPEAARGEIRFEGVGFRRGELPVLQGIDLAVPAGSKVGLLGPSGAGKSTLVDLLVRHYDPDAGRITLDGIDVRRLDLADLRRRIAVVSQELALLPISIAENIRYPDPHVPDETVRLAARRAQADGFIEALPEGYDSVIGYRGLTLSGGQRQRLAIARALVRDPLVLVLDEATNALDAAAERSVIGEIDTLFAGRTRIIVTHRAEALEDVDLLLELGEGRIRKVPAGARKAAG
jgi:ATP-binding cassette subfamily B protein